MTDKPLTMGKKFNCHLGHFELPSEIYEVEIDYDRIVFYCEDGVYQANEDNEWKITKVSDEQI